MSIVCCGVKYSKSDPETYWCFDTDILKPIQKKYVGNDRVHKEVVDSLTCKKCGCLIVTITRYGKFKGHKKRLEIEKLKGLDAVEYLNKTSEFRVRQPLTCPIQGVPFSRNIDICYGKVIAPDKQRPRYVNEQDWGGKEVYTSKVTEYGKRV